MRSPASNLIKRLLILYGIREGLPRRRFRIVVQRIYGLALSRDVTLVPQLVLPLVVRLGYHRAPQERHFWIQSDPQDGRVAGNFCSVKSTYYQGRIK